MNVENLFFSVSVGSALTDDEKHVEAAIAMVDSRTNDYADFPLTEHDHCNAFIDPSNVEDRARAHAMLDRWLDAIAALPV